MQQKEAVFSNLQNLPEEWQNIQLLINNAGLALGKDAFDEALKPNASYEVIKKLIYVVRNESI